MIITTWGAVFGHFFCLILMIFQKNRLILFPRVCYTLNIYSIYEMVFTYVYIF